MQLIVLVRFRSVTLQSRLNFVDQRVQVLTTRILPLGQPTQACPGADACPERLTGTREHCCLTLAKVMDLGGDLGCRCRVWLVRGQCLPQQVFTWL